jgi:hypothetical protein
MLIPGALKSIEDIRLNLTGPKETTKVNIPALIPNCKSYQ